MFVPVHAVILDCDSNGNRFKTFFSTYSNINPTTGLVEDTYGTGTHQEAVNCFTCAAPLLLWCLSTLANHPMVKKKGNAIKLIVRMLPVDKINLTLVFLIFFKCAV